MDVEIGEMTVQLGLRDQHAGEQVGRELRRLIVERLAGLRHDPDASGTLDIGAVDLGTLAMPASRDPAAIAGLIADRLAGWLQDALARPEEPR
ncbi:MAG: hypothetical protein U1E53_31375 [Dongiaceae bacterium]